MTSRLTIVERPNRLVVARAGVPGPPGAAGPPGGAGYTHAQAMAAATWTVNHNLGRRPSIVVLTTGGVEVDAAVTHTSAMQAVIAFNAPQAGSAVCT